MTPLPKAVFYKQLHELLQKYFDTIKQLSSSPTEKSSFSFISNQLDEMVRQAPPDIDPQLLHYLNRKSYEKAFRSLENSQAEIEKGTCGH